MKGCSFSDVCVCHYGSKVCALLALGKAWSDELNMILKTFSIMFNEFVFISSIIYMYVCMYVCMYIAIFENNMIIMIKLFVCVCSL